MRHASDDRGVWDATHGIRDLDIIAAEMLGLPCRTLRRS
jgi:hypothetical protein